jgi:oxaloacetate decarboxylase alpha subunit
MWAAQDAGFAPGVPAEYDPRIYDHQLPGGMTGTFKNQLAQHGMPERLPEVLAEIPRVRQELGQPIMATPFSQFVGIQAVLNVITRDRYSIVPDEVVHYVLGHYGPLRAAVDPDVFDRVMASPRAPGIRNWERPQPSLSEVRSLYRSDMSDEELLLRYMTSDVEVDAMLAAGPVRTVPPTRSRDILDHLVDIKDASPKLTSLSVGGSDFSITVGRRASTSDAIEEV